MKVWKMNLVKSLCQDDPETDTVNKGIINGS